MSVAVVLLGLIPQMAFAHGGHAQITGVFAGLMHSVMHALGGADHLLALVAVGLLAIFLVRRSA
jgi:urease accessory protein